MGRSVGKGREEGTVGKRKGGAGVHVHAFKKVRICRRG